MTLIKVKICGLSRIQDVLAVNECMPDYIGFVFAESKRQISKSEAADLRRSLNKNISAVGVFVNEDLSRIIDICDSKIIDVVQLHGDETNEYINDLRTHIQLPIIKSIRVKNAMSLEQISTIPSDYILFDSYSDSCYGGNGDSFDWTLIPNTINKQFFLAGGINPVNIHTAISLGAYCIDVSTGVETNGIKDPSKIREMIKLIRGVN